MNVAIIERTQASRQHSNSELVEALRLCRRQFDDDLGMTIMGLFFELCERNAALEQRVRLLESKRR